MNSPNPYESPINEQEDSAVETEYRENLKFSTGLAKFMALFCVVSVAHSTYATIRDCNYLNLEFDGWTGLHMLTLTRALLIPCLLAFAVVCWKSARPFKIVTGEENVALDILAKRHTWLWLGISLFAIYTLFEVFARYYLLPLFGNPY